MFSLGKLKDSADAGNIHYKNTSVIWLTQILTGIMIQFLQHLLLPVSFYWYILHLNYLLVLDV